MGQRIFITGTAGFIGYHLAKLFLRKGHVVHGYDGITPYYDMGLKQRRQALLFRHSLFSATEGMLEDEDLLGSTVTGFRPDVVVHLAAQAGVRYSLEQPRSYVSSNVIGTFNLLECVRRQSNVQHLLMASTSSIYGASEKMPFSEMDKSDAPLSIYAATKKASEAVAHSYAHLYGIPTTVFRFFTVYGPWGRPDMAYFKFTSLILDRKPIDIYNFGQMKRDFTYVDDLVEAIDALKNVPPVPPGLREVVYPSDSLSAVAPFRVVNIGRSDPVELLDFIGAIEDTLGQKAIHNHMDMQQGDVPATWADTSLLKELTGYEPSTSMTAGVRAFVKWYLDEYHRRQVVI